MSFESNGSDSSCDILVRSLFIERGQSPLRVELHCTYIRKDLKKTNRVEKKEEQERDRDNVVANLR